MYEPSFTRDRTANERLAARACDACGWVSFPEHRAICKRCGSHGEWSDTRLATRGTVQSYVVQRRLPESFETPLPLAIVDVPQRTEGEPARVYGLFTETDPDDLEIGAEAEAVFRRVFAVDGLPVHSFKFRLTGGDDE